MKYNQLSREQRYAIYLGLQEKKTLTVIARQIGCSVSTVSREINRNKNRFGKYVFTIACELTQIRRERSVSNRKLPDYVKKRGFEAACGERLVSGTNFRIFTSSQAYLYLS